MFSFLNSLILPALIAAIIPLIIHLFSRQRSKRVLFSSLRFLKLIENQRIRRVKLYQILLILIRTLFIVLLVLAFSRPTVRDSVLNYDSNSATTAVILIDDTYSMRSYSGAKTRFEKAIDLMPELFDLFSNEDRLYLISTSQPDPVEISFPLENKNNPANYDAGYASSDFSPALKNAFYLFEQYPNVNRELYLISDLYINNAPFQDSLSAGLSSSIGTTCNYMY